MKRSERIRNAVRRPVAITAVLLSLLLVTASLPPMTASAAPGYYYGKIPVVDEPETLSTVNVSYYIGEKKTDVSEMVWVDGGHNGKALKLSGNGEFLRLGYTAARAKQFTFSGWINWQGDAGHGLLGQRVFTIAREQNNYLTLSPYMKDESLRAADGFLNGVYMRYQYGGTRGKVVDMYNLASNEVTYALPQNEWHHLAVVSDGRTIKLYIDGVRWFEEQLLTSVAELSAHSVDIGSGEWGDPTLNALLDDVTLYNSAMNESRIKELAGVEETEPYHPTAPSTTTTEAPTTTAPTPTTTMPQTLDKTVFGVPIWGVRVIVGVVIVYVLLSVILSILKRRENKRNGGDGT